MINDYAKAKGREQPVSAPDDSVNRVRVEKRVLSDVERAEVAASKAVVEERIPEMVPFIKALYAGGAIDGWRDVKAKKHESEAVNA